MGVVSGSVCVTLVSWVAQTRFLREGESPIKGRGLTVLYRLLSLGIGLKAIKSEYDSAQVGKAEVIRCSRECDGAYC